MMESSVLCIRTRWMTTFSLCMRKVGVFLRLAKKQECHVIQSEEDSPLRVRIFPLFGI